MTLMPGNVRLADVPSQARDVAGRLVDNEAVLIHRGQRKVRVLNSVGARIWDLADGDRTVAGIAAIIANEYAIDLATAESDTAAFCAELVGRGLLTLKS